MADNLALINRDFEEKVARDHAKDFHLPYVDIAGFPVNPDILHLVSFEDAKRALLMPFFKVGKTLRIAVVNPDSKETQAVVEQLKENGFMVNKSLSSESGLLEALKFYASDQYKLKTDVKNVVGEGEIRFEQELANLASLKDKIALLSGEEALNLLHVSAIKAGASDIHYQPEETFCTIRFRIDGVLHSVFDLSREIYERLANQLKYKAGMKLNITSIPQDGRFRFRINERNIDVRLSSLPTEFGEAFVCRILDSGRHFESFEALGFQGQSLEVLQKVTSLAHGMVLVTGPTSSGKTTTLYVLLRQLHKPELKIITLEDPIEYHLSGITQSQINEKRGYTFATGLRSILRQDPDIVMIGEIRDLQTAEVAAQAALTGHVFLSTLHTNSAPEAIPRLLTMGVPPFMIAPALSCIIAQRLVRRICQKCKQMQPLGLEEKSFFEKLLQEIVKIAPSQAGSLTTSLARAKGCEDCNTTGYRGQLVISEILWIDDEMKLAILKNASGGEIFALARKQGMLTMREDGLLKVLAGQTTLEEIQRVTNT